MSSKRLENAKNSLNGITKLYVKWGQHSFIFTLACIIWLVWRVGTKPTRLSYPCAQFALWHTILFFSSASTPFITLVYKCIGYIRNREYHKVARIVLTLAILLGVFTAYQDYQEAQFRLRGSGTIPASSLAVKPWVNTDGLGDGSQYLEFPSEISTDLSVVSVNHNPLIYYGGTPPYDPEDNPAYYFVWAAVHKLRLGSLVNPLDDLIDAGNTVLIKPNWVDFGPAVYTRPEVVRPLIDMAIAAGATTIYVADGGPNVPITDTVISSGNYTDMVSALDSLHTGIDIETVNLNRLDYGWHWINMSTNSSFAGSGYTNAQMGAGGVSLFEHEYYQTSDNQSVNPSGNVTGWYAVNDRILEADVIINAPKMKTHQSMIATMSIKNLVGCTIASTYDEEEEDTQVRIPHYHYELGQYYFDNDIFWRAILDMNKILLYADENGVLQSAQQRKYLNVVDGIQAMEKSQHHEYGGGGVPYTRNVVLAGVDPVAVDAVGCRIMGYDYSLIPSISNADSDTVHPIGINAPEDIVIMGAEIDNCFDYVFQFNDDWSENATTLGLAITDFTPPTINSVDRVGDTVTADISGGSAASILYEVAGVEYIDKMSKAGDTYSVTVPGTVSEYQIMAQDDCFNTAQVVQTSPLYEHPGGFHSQAQISAAKQKIQGEIQPTLESYNRLITKVDGYSDNLSQAVEDYYAPGYYQDPAGSDAAKRLIHGDGFTAYTCALAYQLTEGVERIQYADKAVEFVNSWGAINKTVSGTDGNEYMCCGGIGMVLAADLLWDYDGWDLGDRNMVKDWINDVFRNSADIMKTYDFDWGCWGVWASLAASYFVEDAATINDDIALIEDRVSWYIAEDGHIPIEANKGGYGMWYTYYALAPLTSACQVAVNAAGVDLFHYLSPNGRSIQLALDHFFYYSQHPDEWPYYDGTLTMVPDPHDWPGNVYKAMASIYSNANYDNWVGSVYDDTWWYSKHITWVVPVLMQTLPVYGQDNISITLTDAGSFGINFGDVNPGDVSGDVDQSDGIPAIQVWVASETAVSVDISIKGVTTGLIPLENWKISKTFTGTPYSINATYDVVYSSVSSNSTYDFYHWVDVPADTTSGSCNCTIYYKAVSLP